MKIDLRSDTLTQPTQAMKAAMLSAPLGDDVFGEDPTVNKLQQIAAGMFGMDDALFCPSGTMTNQIAIRLHTEPQSEVICDKLSHIYLYEAGGIAYNSMASVRLLEGHRGKLRPEMIQENINNPDDIHLPVSRMVALENTVNKGGGAIYRLEEIQAIAELCKKTGLKLHLDGARLFNALAETKEDPSAYGKCFDSISVCLSKGLGAPVGSLLIGSQVDIMRAKRIRKVLGGGMRQAGMLAAAGIYALEHHLIRIKEDHQRASMLGNALATFSLVTNVMPVDTNIVIFTVEGNYPVAGILNKLKDEGLLAVQFGKQQIRLVTHLDFDDDQLERAIVILRKVLTPN